MGKNTKFDDLFGDNSYRDEFSRYNDYDLTYGNKYGNSSWDITREYKMYHDCVWDYTKKKTTEEYLKEYNITSYTINGNGIVDVQGDVYIPRNGMNRLPIIFGRVSGDFRCAYNSLTTLIGCPSYVDGKFIINSNSLTSLQYSPLYVGSDFECNYNNIRTLYGITNDIGGNLKCIENRLSTLKYLPTNLKGFIELGEHFIQTPDDASDQVKLTASEIPDSFFDPLFSSNIDIDDVIIGNYDIKRIKRKWTLNSIIK